MISFVASGLGVALLPEQIKRLPHEEVTLLRGKLPSGKDRLHDFEAVPDPVDASQQCCLVHARRWRQRKLEDDFRLYSWLSETHERERIADLGEIVYRAVVQHIPR